MSHLILSFMMQFFESAAGNSFAFASLLQRLKLEGGFLALETDYPAGFDGIDGSWLIAQSPATQ
jgi:hypothetical protein